MSRSMVYLEQASFIRIHFPFIDAFTIQFMALRLLRLFFAFVLIPFLPDLRSQSLKMQLAHHQWDILYYAQLRIHRYSICFSSSKTLPLFVRCSGSPVLSRHDDSWNGHVHNLCANAQQHRPHYFLSITLHITIYTVYSSILRIH